MTREALANPKLARWFQPGTFNGFVDFQGHREDRAREVMGAMASTQTVVLEEGKAPTAATGVAFLVAALGLGWFVYGRRLFRPTAGAGSYADAAAHLTPALPGPVAAMPPGTRPEQGASFRG